MPLTARDWIEAYRTAWVTADSDAVAELFAPDGVYCWDLLHPPAVGREAIKRYWDGECVRQADVDVRFGTELSADPSRVGVEFWTQMRIDGEETTLYGYMLLRFDDEGRCTELREYWLTGPGRHAPPPIWGV